MSFIGPALLFTILACIAMWVEIAILIRKIVKLEERVNYLEDFRLRTIFAMRNMVTAIHHLKNHEEDDWDFGCSSKEAEGNCLECIRYGILCARWDCKKGERPKVIDTMEEILK